MTTDGFPLQKYCLRKSTFLQHHFIIAGAFVVALFVESVSFILNPFVLYVVGTVDTTITCTSTIAVRRHCLNLPV